MPTFSQSLEKSLHQALTFANERHQEFATLEHLLLALVDDKDAAAVMKGCSVNLDALRASLGDDVSAVFVAYPNYLGSIEDLAGLADDVHAAGALLVLSADPMALSVLKTPAELGADICVGEGQPLGNRLDFGGPSFGFFAAREAFLRRMPGRIAGETTDVDGRRGFVLTLQTREQHIRREKATSNICTSQALNALAGVVYLGWLGREGLPELANLLVQRTHYARTTLAAVDGVELLHEQPVVREFALRLPGVDVAQVVAYCQDHGVNPGLALSRTHAGEYDDGLLVALTEQRTKDQIDELATLLGRAIEAQRSGATSASPGAGSTTHPAEVSA